MSPEKYAEIIVDSVLANFGIHKNNAGDVPASEFDEMRAYTMRSVALALSSQNSPTEAT